MIERLRLRPTAGFWSISAANPRVTQFGGIFALLLLATALALLQVSLSGKALVFWLPSYGLIAIAAIISLALVRSSSRADPLCLYASTIFCGYIIFRALTSPVTYVARADLYAALAALTLYGVTATVLSSSVRRMALIISLLTFAMLHVLLGLIQFGAGQNFMLIPWLETLKIDNRASGFYSNPDHLAGLLEVLGIFGLSIACWSRWPGWAKVIVAYLTATCYFGLALTGSRGGYLSVAASLAVFAVLSLLVTRVEGTVRSRKIAAAGLAALAAALLIAVFLISQNVFLNQRLGNIFSVDETRLDLWRASIAQWKLQPISGTGSGTYLFYGRQFRAERMQADPVVVHNDYLHLLCEYGLLGLAAFGLFFYAHLRHGWRNFWRLGPKRIAAEAPLYSNRLALNIAALSAIAAYVVHSAVDFNLHIPANALLLAFVFGVVANPDTTAGSEIPRPGVAFIPRIAIATLAAILLFQCVRLFPGEYYAERARVALEDENPSTAISFVNKALAYERQNPKIFFYLGRAQMALGNQEHGGEKRVTYYESALAAFDRARVLAPLEEAYPLDMAYAYDNLGRFPEAEWMHSIARSLDPKSSNVAQLYETHLEAWQNYGQKNVAGDTDAAVSKRP